MRCRLAAGRPSSSSNVLASPVSKRPAGLKFSARTETTPRVSVSFVQLQDGIQILGGLRKVFACSQDGAHGVHGWDRVGIGSDRALIRSHRVVKVAQLLGKTTWNGVLATVGLWSTRCVRDYDVKGAHYLIGSRCPRSVEGASGGMMKRTVAGRAPGPDLAAHGASAFASEAKDDGLP